MKFKILIPILFTSVIVLASAGSHEAANESGVPRVVLYQAINVFIIFVTAYWLARHKVSAFFYEKRKKYIEDQDKAKQVLVIAQDEHHEVKTRLDKLKSNKLDTLSKAKAEASDLHKKILIDADLMVKRLKNDADLSAKIELLRAKNELRDLLVKEAFELSQKEIELKATLEDQKRLQREFIAKVEVVQ